MDGYPSEPCIKLYPSGGGTHIFRRVGGGGPAAAATNHHNYKINNKYNIKLLLNIKREI
jgi:hypothetical protein